MKKTKQITVFSGYVIKDHKILLVQRSEPECPDAHLKWELPGGKVDFGETPEESVIREIYEETGVKAKIQKLLPLVTTAYWDYAWGTQQTLCFVYICTFVSQEKMTTKDHHVEQIKWVALEEAKTLQSLPGTKEVIDLLEK